ncbi:MAG: Gfo/Idh/MocA family oxidoreductase [Bacteroidia bacterium]|nr:Gfo/Idh/MocA family oxidoreductase [Bacteroidia bacterium]MDW8301797.1 Gfo/Idh/MocA family oxidoreductase [Bacteroidia bacterium]
MKNVVNFAIIGCGYIGNRHAESITAHPEAKLVACTDINTTLKTEIETKYKVPFFESAEDMLNAGLDIDVVCVCTPNGLHTLHSILALNYKKHVVCEKPMGLTKKSCEEVIYKALQVHKQVFCVMQNRYSPPAVWLKSVVQQGILGKIYMVQINCYWNRDDRYYKKGSWKGSKELDGGVLYTQFSHFIDIMYWLFGDITNIQAHFKNFAHQHNTELEDDSGVVQFEFINGGIGSINYSTAVWDKNMESSITIIGERGSIKVGGQYMEKVEYCHIKDYVMPVLPPSNPPNDYGSYKGSAANHSFVIDNVIKTIQGLAQPTTNALEGLKVVEIIERIYQLRK